MLLPKPNCPTALLPQTTTRPSCRIAMLYPGAAEMAMASPIPGTCTGSGLPSGGVPAPSSPFGLGPQPHTVPFPAKARLWGPEAMAVMSGSLSTRTGTLAPLPQRQTALSGIKARLSPYLQARRIALKSGTAETAGDGGLEPNRFDSTTWKK